MATPPKKLRMDRVIIALLFLAAVAFGIFWLIRSYVL
jgi:predicted secreted protein